LKNAPFRHRVEHALYSTVKAGSGLLPVSAARALGRRIGDLSHALGGSKRRLALDNMQLAMPELSETERKRAVRGCFRHLGANFFETLRAFRHDRADIDRLLEIEGREHLDEARALDKGLLILTGHFGYWELAAQWLGHHLGNFNVIYRPADNPYFDADIAKLRGQAGIGLIPKDGAGVKLMRTLKRRHTVGILLDQRVREQGIQLEFFGQPALTSPLMAALSIRSGAPVVPVFCYPLERGRYRVRFEPMITRDDPVRAGLEGDEAAQALTRRYLKVMEDAIRAQPELWLWMHRRWRL